MTRQEKEQELIDAGISGVELSEALAAWEKEQEKIQQDAEQAEADGEEIIKISNSFANSLGFNAPKGVGVFSLTRNEFQQNENVKGLARQQLDKLKSDEFTQANAEEVYQKGLKNYFKIDEIEDYETADRKGSKSDEALAVLRFRRDKLNEINPETIGTKGYPKGRKYTDREIQAMPEMIELRRRNEKKFANEAEYEEYLKKQLGDRYEDYKLYQASLNEDGVYQPAEGIKEISIDDKSLQDAELEIYSNKLRNELTNVQADASGKDAMFIFEAAQALNMEDISESQKVFEKTRKGFDAEENRITDAFNTLEKERQPYIDNLTNLGNQLQSLSDTYSTSLTVDDPSKGIQLQTNWTKEQADEYNALYEEYQAAYVDYETQNFDAQYDILVKDTELLRTSMENYNKNLEDYGQDMMQADVLNKFLGMDYSLGARASAALEDFFIGGAVNVGMNIKEGGLRLFKALNNDELAPEREAKLQKSIELCQQTLTNYNQRIAAKREAEIPPPLELDDIGKDGVSVFRYVGEALADNSPSILTTFIPAGAAIAGSLKVAGAAGKGFGAMRAALKAQKTYAFYAMRASQTIFFAGESGGKIGDLSIKQGEQMDRVKALNEALNRKGDGAILNEEERDLLIAERDELQDELNSNMSFAIKSFGAYSYGGTAALAETLGSLKLVAGANASARSFGKQVAKAAAYENSAKFAGVLAGGFIRGLRPAITKAMPSELMEESLTQISHNAIDTIVLGEDKPITEGLNADFFVKTAITSFAIMAPTTMNNTRQILQNEFTTRDEVLQNKTDVNELLNIQTKLDDVKFTGPAKVEAFKRRRQLVKKLGFSDAFKMQKLNHMSEAEIREVAELSRRERALGAQMRGLAGTGDTQGSDAVNAKKKIQNQFDAIAERKNELLGAKKRNTLKKMTDLNNRFGMTVNLDMEYSLGLYDFAQDAAMTMSDKNSKYTVVSDAAYFAAQDGNLDVMQQELAAEGYSEAEIENITNKFTGDSPSNGMFTEAGDIVINEGGILQRIHGATSVTDGQYASVAPLEELFHQLVSKKKIKIDGKTKTNADQSVSELQDVIDNKLSTVKDPAKIKALNDLKGRIKLYEGGPNYYEETLAQINNALTLGTLTESDIAQVPSLKSFINNSISQILGDPAWMLQLESASDVVNFLKNHQRNIQDTKVLDGGTDEDDPLNAKPAVPIRDKESVGEALPEATQAYMDLDNSMLQQGLNSAIQNDTDQQFPLAQALVEKNWGLISPSLNINSEQEMNAAKEVVIDQLLGKFEGSGVVQFGTKQYPARGTSALAGFSLDPEGGSSAAQVSTYLTETIKRRKPEIDAAIVDKTKAGIEVNQGITSGAVTQTEISEVETAKPTPSETTTYSDETLKRVNTDKAGLETRITEAVEQSYPGRKDVKLAETRNIPEPVAEIYTEMLGITNPNRLTDKSQTFSVTDEAGLRNAKVFLDKNAQADFNRLPDALDASGKGTFIPLNVKKALYTNGEKTGTLKDYKNLIKTPATKKIYRDSAKVGTIRGLLGLHIRNRILETGNPDAASRIASGAKFSKGEKIQRQPKDDTRTPNQVLADMGRGPVRIQTAADGSLVVDSGPVEQLTPSGRTFDKRSRQSEGEKVQRKKPRTKSVAEQEAEIKLDNKRIQELGRISRISTDKVLRDNGITPLGVTPGDGRLADRLTDKGRRIRNESMIAALPKLGLSFIKASGFYDINGIFKNKADFDSIFDMPLTQEFVEKNNLQDFVTTSDTGITTLDKSKLPKSKIDPKNTYSKSISEQRNYKGFSLEQRKEKLQDKDFQDLQKDKMEVLNNLASVIQQEIINKDGSINVEKAAFWSKWLGTSGALSTHPIRSLAPITFFSDSKLRGKKNYVAEHTMPANIVTSTILDMALQGRVETDFDFIKNNYQQGQLLKSDDDKVNIFYKIGVPQEFFDNENASVWIRYAHTDLNMIDTQGGINLNSYLTTKNFGTKVVTVAESLGLGLNKNQYQDKNGNDIPAVIHYQNELLYDLQVDDELKASNLKKKLNKAIPVKKAEQIQVDKNANELGGPLKPGVTPQAAKNTMLNSLESKGEVFKKDKPTKGISVFDFDDTLAKTKEKVIVNMPDGKIKEISASEFAETANLLEGEGATFDFSNFDKVSKSTAQGPLADLARRRQEKFGSKDIFVLTARPQASAASIKQFLDSIGINIPIENITGLEDGSPQAKVDWVLNKTAEGYNDFYFADDSLANVKGVKQVLDAIDVKNDVQQAKESKGERLNKEFNKQLEEVTGVESFKKYSTVRARLEGKKKDGGILKRIGRQFTITYSAEDFAGLTYALRGKGEQGNKHAKFIEDNLITPYNRAELALLTAKVNVGRDFAALRKKFPSLRGSKLSLTNPLLAEIDGGPFNKEQAVRVYLWNKQGNDIPDMSKRDINRLVKAVEADPELSVFADELQLIQKSKDYPPPGKNWLGGSIKNDILNAMDKSFRSELMAEFNENVDMIFTPENLNKLEALFGSKYREALEDSIRRMKSGSNRPKITGSGARVVNEMLDWLNASVANVMFLNMRSGLLQSLSTVNFINWGDNNIYAAAKAFASPEMWPTFMKLMNSDYLVNRRDGLRINVNEAELADAAKKGGIKGAFSFLLDKGFAITRIMDSFAIALGGSTFFINRKKALLNRVNPDTGKLYTEAEAETKAFEDFYAIAEETQQSSNPSKISSQQASIAGRLLLSFQNVTMQMNRKAKKSILDLYNRRKKPGMTQRESDLSNLSSIVYYTTIQNIVFNALQQGLFAMLFDEEEEDKKKEEKLSRTLNGMADSLLFGLGFGGAIVATTKNILRRIADENTKKKPDYRDIPDDVFDVSSVIDAKYRKLKTSARTFTFNREEIKKRGWSLDNPAYLAVAQIISAVTNAPIDRVLQKVNNLRQASDEEVRMWQRVALVMGWSGWNFGLPYWGRQSTIDKENKDAEKVKENYEKQVKEIKSKGFTKKIPLSGPNHYKPKGELGVDYVQVERPSGEIQYYIKP